MSHDVGEAGLKLQCIWYNRVGREVVLALGNSFPNQAQCTGLLHSEKLLTSSSRCVYVLFHVTDFLLPLNISFFCPASWTAIIASKPEHPLERFRDLCCMYVTGVDGLACFAGFRDFFRV